MVGVKRILGLSAKGNAVTRQMRAAKRCINVNEGITFLSLSTAVAGSVTKDFNTTVIAGSVGILGILDNIKLIKNLNKLYPEYNKIVQRAKSIYKK